MSRWVLAIAVIALLAASMIRLAALAVVVSWTLGPIPAYAFLVLVDLLGI
jgi:hypothetical protein